MYSYTYNSYTVQAHLILFTSTVFTVFKKSPYFCGFISYRVHVRLELIEIAQQIFSKIMNGYRAINSL